MVSIIEFKPRHAETREPQQWLCNCDCLTFYVYDDGRIVCAKCKVEQDVSLSQLGWRREASDAEPSQ